MLRFGTQPLYSVALSSQANYTDYATATCRRNLVPTFVDRDRLLGLVVRVSGCYTRGPGCDSRRYQIF
jgi:hypothetical protein